MIIFRPRRLTLEDAMAEAAIFEDMELMLDHIVKINTYSGLGPMVSKDDISIDKKTSFEKSTGWKDCRKVLVSRFGGEDYSPPRVHRPLRHHFPQVRINKGEAFAPPFFKALHAG